MQVASNGNELIVTLDDGTIVRHWYHVCDSCTSVDTWITGPYDTESTTSDPTRQTVRGFAWNRNGGRTNIDSSGDDVNCDACGGSGDAS